MKPLLSRAAAVATASLVALLAATPAWALDDGEAPHDSTFTTLDVLLIFVGIPLLATLVIVLLVYAPHSASRPRYRPGRPYDGDPLWFDGPSRPERALESGAASTEDVRGGGASASW
ncbi:MAG: hypothetical protein QOJ92_1073 [Frankiales bacterium]|nr:hypothetical protein [Frankiales bacterium]